MSVLFEKGQAKVKNRVRFSYEDAVKATWLNCGPSALCAVLNKTPEEIRPHLLDFEKKGYTNPTLMTAILDGLGVKYRRTFRDDKPIGMPIVDFGLMRVQWSGPWTKPGVPIQARYRQTHWVAVAEKSAEIFDINAICSGGWLPEAEWTLQLIPWLIKEVCPKGDGGWWPTHVLEIERA